MKIYAKKYKWYRDFFFQCQILFDKSIQHFMFDNKRKMIDYFLPSNYEVKYVVVRENEGVTKKISIMTFMKDKRDGVFWIAGFVPTRMQNKGLGLYGAIASLHELFKLYPQCEVISASYSFNTRSVRVSKSIGFSMYVQDECHFEGSLTKEQFDNEFVFRVKKRLNME